MRKAIGRMALTAWLVAAAVPGTANQPLDVRVRPGVGFGPLDIVVQLTVERDERNRSVQVELESDTFFTSSSWELDGEYAPRTKDLRFRQLPPGEYDIRVTLKGEAGTRAVITRQFAVL
jgi:hypothetical protein